MTLSADGYAVPAGEGEAIWFLGTLMTIKATAEETRGAFTLVEQVAPPGFAPPPHVHEAEEEGFYVLEGELTVTCGDRVWTASSGAFVLLPRGMTHTFSVSQAGPAKLLQVTSPAQFERFAREAGDPASTRTLPPPGAPDIPRMLEAMSRYGYRMAGPPPGH